MVFYIVHRNLDKGSEYMVVDKNRFDDLGVKNCKQCGRRMHPEYAKDICPECQELNLFGEVKEYIRNNDVNEADVAEHFGLPNRKVRAWIREGRIQYKNTDGASVSQVYCQICGAPLDFGNLCAKCRHMQGLEVVAKQYKNDSEGMMRFMKNDK